MDKLGKIKIKRNGDTKKTKIIPKTNNKINLIVNNIETRKTDLSKNKQPIGNNNSIPPKNMQIEHKKEVTLPNIKILKREENIKNKRKNDVISPNEATIQRVKNLPIIQTNNNNPNFIDNQLNVHNNIQKVRILHDLPKMKIRKNEENEDKNLSEKDDSANEKNQFKNNLVLVKEEKKEKDILNKQIDNENNSNKKERKMLITKTGGFHFVYSVQNLIYQYNNSEKQLYIVGRDQQNNHGKITFLKSSKKLTNIKSEDLWIKKFNPKIFIKTAHINEVYTFKHINQKKEKVQIE